MEVKGQYKSYYRQNKTGNRPAAEIKKRGIVSTMPPKNANQRDYSFSHLVSLTIPITSCFTFRSEHLPLPSTVVVCISSPFIYCLQTQFLLHELKPASIATTPIAKKSFFIFKYVFCSGPINQPIPADKVGPQSPPTERNRKLFPRPFTSVTKQANFLQKK